MKQQNTWLFVFLLSQVVSYAQTILPGDTLGRSEIWYNEQYFITNANCEFAAIRRVVKIDLEKKTFTGDFTDYDRQGRTLLTGSYKNGKKDGVFRAWYPGGYLKMEGRYDAGKPAGAWYFYYNDGKPLAIMEAGVVPRITDHWNVNNQQVVKEGNGGYIITDLAFGYNPEGYDARMYAGKLVNGLPDGDWRILHITRGSRALYALEHFEGGRFVFGRGEDYEQDSTSKMLFLPSSWFDNAEDMTAKPCNVDDQFNFSVFLQNELNNNRGVLLKETAESLPPEVNVKLYVNRSGTPSGFKIEGSMGRTRDRALSTVLQNIRYWIPSQSAGKWINDTLSLQLKIETGPDGKPLFAKPVITRKTGT